MMTISKDDEEERKKERKESMEAVEMV